ncbi:hypothetical protein [Sphingomonas faeni]|nr:hypothetical protein [Sphingomonas faeni]MDQ0839223.1 hypothetical protein [Sphingomonas faeni]
MFLPLPLIVAFAIGLAKAKTTKQREFAAAGLLIGFAAIAGVSALFVNGS